MLLKRDKRKEKKYQSETARTAATNGHVNMGFDDGLPEKAGNDVIAPTDVTIVDKPSPAVACNNGLKIVVSEPENPSNAQKTKSTGKHELHREYHLTRQNEKRETRKRDWTAGRMSRQRNDHAEKGHKLTVKRGTVCKIIFVLFIGLGGRLLLCFSVLDNGRKLLDCSRGQADLSCLHGLRVISITWVVLGHCFSMFIGATGNTLGKHEQSIETEGCRGNCLKSHLLRSKDYAC